MLWLLLVLSLSSSEDEVSKTSVLLFVEDVSVPNQYPICCTYL